MTDKEDVSTSRELATSPLYKLLMQRHVYSGKEDLLKTLQWAHDWKLLVEQAHPDDREVYLSLTKSFTGAARVWLDTKMFRQGLQGFTAEDFMQRFLAYFADAGKIVFALSAFANFLQKPHENTEVFLERVTKMYSTINWIGWHKLADVSALQDPLIVLTRLEYALDDLSIREELRSQRRVWREITVQDMLQALILECQHRSRKEKRRLAFGEPSRKSSGQPKQRNRNRKDKPAKGDMAITV